MAAKPFTIEVAEIERKTPTRTVAIDETYRPIFDALSKLDDDHALNLTFPDERTADAAKSTVQELARQAGYTARERRGQRTVNDDGTVSLSLVKRPKPRRETDPTAPAEVEAKTDAPGE